MEREKKKGRRRSIDADRRRNPPDQSPSPPRRAKEETRRRSESESRVDLRPVRTALALTALTPKKPARLPGQEEHDMSRGLPRPLPPGMMLENEKAAKHGPKLSVHEEDARPQLPYTPPEEYYPPAPEVRTRLKAKRKLAAEWRPPSSVDVPLRETPGIADIHIDPPHFLAPPQMQPEEIKRPPEPPVAIPPEPPKLRPKSPVAIPPEPPKRRPETPIAIDKRPPWYPPSAVRPAKIIYSPPPPRVEPKSEPVLIHDTQSSPAIMRPADPEPEPEPEEPEDAPAPPEKLPKKIKPKRERSDPDLKPQVEDTVSSPALLEKRPKPKPEPEPPNKPPKPPKDDIKKVKQLMKKYGKKGPGGDSKLALSRFGIPDRKEYVTQIMADSLNHGYDFAERVQHFYSPVLRGYAGINMTKRYRAALPSNNSVKALDVARIDERSIEEKRWRDRKKTLIWDHYLVLRKAAVDDAHYTFLKNIAETQLTGVPFTIMEEILDDVLPVFADVYRSYAYHFGPKNFRTNDLTNNYLRLLSKVKMYKQM